MSVMTSRTVVSTALRSAPARSRWEDRAACREEEVDRDLFFADDKGSQDAAREVCQSCPVLTSCLRATQRVESTTADAYGIAGGLTATQRRALGYAQRLGHHPDLAKARMLMLDARWRERLERMQKLALTPRVMAHRLRPAGLVVDEVTVRLAVWWSGGSAGLVGRSKAQDLRPKHARIREDFEDLVVALRSLGASHADVAAYLGVTYQVASRAVTEIERAAAGAKAEVAA